MIVATQRDGCRFTSHNNGLKYDHIGFIWLQCYTMPTYNLFDIKELQMKHDITIILLMKGNGSDEIYAHEQRSYDHGDGRSGTHGPAHVDNLGGVGEIIRAAENTAHIYLHYSNEEEKRALEHVITSLRPDLSWTLRPFPVEFVVHGRPFEWMNNQSNYVMGLLKDACLQELLQGPDAPNKPFEKALRKFKDKVAELEQRKETAAHAEAKRIYDALEAGYSAYMSSPTYTNYRNFHADAKKSIEDASELKNHRQLWKVILGNILLAIVGIGVIYGIAVARNGGFFFGKTKSQELIEELDITKRDIPCP